MTCLELFYGLMLPSGNDSAYCLGESFGLLVSQNGESQQRMVKEIIDAESKNLKESMVNIFIEEMNKECSIIGMEDTHYANVHGLPNIYNVSTAFD